MFKHIIRVLALFAMMIAIGVCNDANAKTFALTVGYNNHQRGDPASAIQNGEYNCSRIDAAIKLAENAETTAVCNSQATKQSQLTALGKAVREAKADDVIFVTVITHGYQTETSTGLIPYDWDPADDATGIDLKRDLLPMIEGRNPEVKVVIAPDLNRKADQTWGEEGYALLHGPTAKDFAGLKNVWVISAAFGEGYFPEPGDSTFGDALAELWLSDVNQDGRVTLVELKDLLYQKMGAVERSPQVEGDFSIDFVLFEREVEKQRSPANWNRRIMYGSLGAGGVGLVYGGVQYGRMLGAINRLKSYDYKTDDDYRTLTDRVDTTYTQSLVGWGVAGAGLATAGVCWWREAHGHQPVITPAVGPTSISFSGRW